MAGIRWMNNIRPKIRVLVEYVRVSGLFVATAFDEEQTEVGSASAHMPDVAVARCLQKLPRGKYEVDIEVMNSPEDDDDDDDDEVPLQ